MQTVKPMDEEPDEMQASAQVGTGTSSTVYATNRETLVNSIEISVNAAGNAAVSAKTYFAPGGEKTADEETAKRVLALRKVMQEMLGGSDGPGPQLARKAVLHSESPGL